MAYRYRHTNCTSRCLKRIDFALSRLGDILSVAFKRYEGRYGKQEAIFIKGMNGTARFIGFCWGYSGEGPRGLCELLQKIGVDKLSAEKLAYETPRTNKIGNDQVLTFGDDGLIFYN